jgi:hypothetical protein
MVINGYKIRKYNNFGLPPGYAALIAKNSFAGSRPLVPSFRGMNI